MSRKQMNLGLQSGTERQQFFKEMKRKRSREVALVVDEEVVKASDF